VPKYIIDLNNEGKKYAFNLYVVHEYEDGAVSEDARVIESDNIDEFISKLNRKLKRDERLKKQETKNV
jgi:hypothetical protein